MKTAHPCPLERRLGDMNTCSASRAMNMSRYSSVKEARGSMTVLILSLSIRKPWSSMNSVCGPS